MEHRGELFTSVSVGKLLAVSSGSIFFIIGYCVPVTMETVGGNLQDLVYADTLQRYVIRSILISYLPFLLLSTITYHITSSLYSSSSSSTVSSIFNPPPLLCSPLLINILRTARTLSSLIELCSLAVFACVTPSEDYGLHHDAARILVSTAAVTMLLTVVMVRMCYHGNRYQNISVAIKCAVLGLWGLLRFAWPIICTGEKAECMIDEAFFLPLFALYHGSGVLDIGGKRLVVRNRNQQQFDRNVQQVIQDRIARQRAHDLEDSSGSES